MSAAKLGFIVVAVLWAVVLIPMLHGIIRFIRTTRPQDLIPRIRRVPETGVLMVVSRERSRFDPEHWEQITPFAWRRKQT